MVNESMKRVSINRLSMEPSRIVKAILEPDYPHAHLEWNVTGEGIEITPMDRQCVVEPIDFDGDSAKATVTATIPDSPSFVGTSASCDVTVVKQPTAIQLSAVGAPGGYMVTVVQPAESYSRLWKLDAGDVYQGDVCDEPGGWQTLPEDGIIAAQAGTLTVVDVDAESKAKRAGSCTLAPSNNLAYYGPVDGKATITSDGALHFDGTMTAWQRVSWDVPGDVFARIKGKTVLITKQESNSTRFGIDVAGGAKPGYTCITQSELSRQVPVPADAESAKIVVEAPSNPVTSPYDYHVGMYVDVEEAPAWKPGIIVGGGGLVETPNLWPVMKDPVTLGGVTFTPNGDGSVTVDGESANTYPSISVSTVLLPGTYLIRATRVTDIFTQAKWLDEKLSTADGRDGRFTLDSECTVTLQVVCSSNKTFDNVTLTPFLHAESAGGGVSDKRPNLLTYAGFHSADTDMAVNADGSFDLTVTDWTQWRNFSFDLPEGLLAAGREYTLSVQEPYETPTVNMHVRTGGSGYGPLKLTYGKSSVTATPDAISITPNLTIINEQPDPTSGSLRNVRLKLEEGDSPTGWVPPVVSSGGGYSNILPAVKTGDSWNGQFTCERLGDAQYRVHGVGTGGWYSWGSETVTLPAGTYMIRRTEGDITIEIHEIRGDDDRLAGYATSTPTTFETDGSIGLRFVIAANPKEQKPYDRTVAASLVRVSDDPGSGGGYLGCPNLFPRFEPVTSNGVALTPLDGDGLVSLTGTSATAFAFKQVMTLPPGEYVLSQEIVTPSATVSMYDVFARTHGESAGDQLFTSFRNDVFRVTERREIRMEILVNEDKTMDDYRIRFTLRSQ